MSDPRRTEEYGGYQPNQQPYPPSYQPYQIQYQQGYQTADTKPSEILAIGIMAIVDAGITVD